MNTWHSGTCICTLCAPESTPAPLATLQSAPAVQPDVELAQAVALFKQLDDRHRALTIALMTCGIRLQGKRG